MKSKDKIIDLEAKRQEKENNQIQITNRELRAFFIPVQMNFMDPANARFMSTPYIELMTSEKSKELLAKARIKLMKLDMRISEELKILENVRKELVEKYCKKDKEGKPILKPPNIGRDPKKKLSPEEEEMYKKTIENIPKDRWTHEFEEENQKLFTKEFEELLNENADIQGDKITLRSDDLPKGLLNPGEMGSLAKIINFEE